MADFEQEILRTKIRSLIFLIAMVISASIAIYFYYQLYSAREQLEDKKVALEEAYRTIDIQKKLLEAAIEENDYEEARSLAENARYKVGLYSLNPVRSNHRKLEEYLTKRGYEVSASVILSKRISWLAAQSTVFYYHEQSRTKAQDLATKMGEQIDVTFRVDLGAGLGVGEGQKEWTFYIHYIGD